MLNKFRRAYKTAVKNNEEMFTFDDNVYVVSYAKYLLEYLEPKL